MGLFKNLYSMDYSVNGALPCRAKFPGFLWLKKDYLKLTVSDEEVQCVVFGMALIKADRFHANFYEAQWNVVGPSICVLVRYVLEGCPLDLGIIEPYLFFFLRFRV